MACVYSTYTNTGQSLAGTCLARTNPAERQDVARACITYMNTGQGAACTCPRMYEHSY